MNVNEASILWHLFALTTDFWKYTQIVKINTRFQSFDFSQLKRISFGICVFVEEKNVSFDLKSIGAISKCLVC